MPAPTPLRETELYAPVKSLLEAQGYEVKSEIGGADVVASRGGEALVVVELKTGFSLALFHQAIARLAVTDSVYIAVPLGRGKPFQRALRDNAALCRRLGLGLILVSAAAQTAEIALDPGPYAPRRSLKKRGRLLREFARRVGDPNTGGARATVMTAYRQDALRCLARLDAAPAKASLVAAETGVPTARRIMADDHYGWFERVERGVYGLTPRGRAALDAYAAEIERLREAAQ